MSQVETDIEALTQGTRPKGVHVRCRYFPRKGREQPPEDNFSVWTFYGIKTQGGELVAPVYEMDDEISPESTDLSDTPDIPNIRDDTEARPSI